MEPASQRRSIEIDRGLYLIRYVTAEDKERPPAVRVRLDRAGAGSATLLFHPDQNDAVLWQPGAALAVRATRPVKLAIEVTSSDQDGSTAALVRIESLTHGAPAQQTLFSNLETVDFDVDGLRLLGHVTRIGDVIVGPREWLAGPSAPSRIEGFSIEWPGKPAHVDVRYAATLARPHAVPGELVTLGSFSGTRGRSLPVVGVTIEISGRDASSCKFHAEAIFLGSPISQATGRRIVLAGPTGSEPLVGLRLALEQMTTPALVSDVQVGTSSGRVRVFRGRSKPAHATAP